jgi:hypothetical protein
MDYDGLGSVLFPVLEAPDLPLQAVDPVSFARGFFTLFLGCFDFC